MLNSRSLSITCKITSLVISGSLLAHIALLHWLGYVLGAIVFACLGMRHRHGQEVKDRVLERYRVGTNYIYSDYTDIDRQEISEAEDTMETVSEIALFLGSGVAITVVGVLL